MASIAGENVYERVKKENNANKPKYPGHLKFMQDIKAVKQKIEVVKLLTIKKSKKKFASDQEFVATRAELEQLRVESQAEGSKLMQKKYEEKQAEELFLKEQKVVEAKLEELNKKNLEYLEQSNQRYKDIKEQDKRIVDDIDQKKKNQQKKKTELIDNIKTKQKMIDNADDELSKKRAEKKAVIKKLRKLEVMRATQDYEKEKQKEGLDKMIQRYQLLKKKQSDLLEIITDLEVKKKKKSEEKINQERELMNKVLKMTSDIHNLQKEIDGIQKNYRDLENDIQRKVLENQKKAIESAKIDNAVENLYRKAKKIRPTKEPEDNEDDKRQEGITDKVKRRLEFFEGVMDELNYFYKNYGQNSVSLFNTKEKKPRK